MAFAFTFLGAFPGSESDSFAENAAEGELSGWASELLPCAINSSLRLRFFLDIEFWVLSSCMVGALQLHISEADETSEVDGDYSLISIIGEGGVLIDSLIIVVAMIGPCNQPGGIYSNF